MAPIHLPSPTPSSPAAGPKPELIFITDEYGRQVVVGVFDPESAEPVMVEQVAEGVYQAFTESADHVHYLYTPTASADPARGVFRRVVERYETDPGGRRRLVTVAETEYDGVTRHVIDSAVATYVVPGSDQKITPTIEPQRTSSTAPSSGLQLVVGGVSLVTEQRFEIIVPGAAALLPLAAATSQALGATTEHLCVDVARETGAPRTGGAGNGSALRPTARGPSEARSEGTEPSFRLAADGATNTNHDTVVTGASEDARDPTEITIPGWRPPDAISARGLGIAAESIWAVVSSAARQAAEDRWTVGGTYDLAELAVPGLDRTVEPGAEAACATTTHAATAQATAGDASAHFASPVPTTVLGASADIGIRTLVLPRAEAVPLTALRDPSVETPLQGIWSSLAGLWGQARSLATGQRPLPLDLPAVAHVGAASRERDGEGGGHHHPQQDQPNGGESDSDDTSDASA